MRCRTVCTAFFHVMAYRTCEFLRVGREQLAPYGVDLRNVRVKDARRNEGGFDLTLGDEKHEFCKKLLLATGLVDEIPRYKGLEPLYGRSVFHCPCCDGWSCATNPWRCTDAPRTDSI